jgi:hypothetical protein
MPLNPEIAAILEPAYGPCIEFGSACSDMRWQPERGHVPRGFFGAVGDLTEVELVLVFSEPGDPHDDETHTGLDSAYARAAMGFGSGRDQFHRNVRAILDLCWPGLPFEEQMRKTWLTESVLCSAAKEGGSVPVRVSRACGNRYLLQQLAKFPTALVVALGGKAQRRLRDLGVTTFLAAGAVAPPGCNRKEIRDSWLRIPEALVRRKKTGA